MDVKQQEYFAAIVEAGGLSKAAKKLYVSQPTLSQFLAKLESTENLQLLSRGSNNSLSLTDAGRIYYESAKRILAIRDEYKRKIAEMEKSTNSRLTVGINAERGIRIITHIISELSILYPDIHVETCQDGAINLQEMVADNRLDIAFSAYNVKNPKLEYINFPPAEIALVMRADHPLAHLGTTTPECGLPHLPLSCFADESFAVLTKQTVLREIIDAYCEELGFRPRIKIETHNSATAFSVVESNLSVSLLPHDLYPSKQNLSYVGLNPPLYYPHAMYYNKSSYLNRFFLDFLKEVKKLSTKDYRSY